MDRKQERLAALERQITRIQRRIALLDRRSNRYSWMRVSIFFGGLALSASSFFLVGWWLCLTIALVALIAFVAVAYVQGTIDRSIVRHTIWSHIKHMHLARMRLDWDAIPDVTVAPPEENHPFEADLDITGKRSLHQLVNTAVSREGSKRLREWLLSTTPNLDAIRVRQSLVRELTPLSIFRDKLTLRSMLSSQRVAEELEGGRLSAWLGQESGTRMVPLLLGGSTALCVLTVVLFVLNIAGILSALWIVSLLCSLLLFLMTKKTRGDLFEDAYYLRDAFATLGVVFEYLEKYPYGNHEHLKALCEPFFRDTTHRPSVLLKRVARIASAATLSKNPFLWLIVNALLPWDNYCAYRLRQYKGQIAANLPSWLDVWFELEALSSLATFAYLNPDYILPDATVNNGPEHEALFYATRLGHPLLPDCQKVTNDFALDTLGEVILITGSNMSGKSTFLRTLGINLCLAYAGGPVNAQSFKTRLFRIFTCIRVSDSVTEGYSYFYAEVQRLKALLVELQRVGFPLFFLIDEIFKGTNNRERLIGSRSYVRALVGRNCLGCISTHDLELVTLANMLPNVKNYHFREEVIDGKMVFDYRLRPGPSPTTNALKIMQMEGLPIDEVGERVEQA